MTHFEQDGLDVFQKELIFEFDKERCSEREKRVQKNMSSKAGRRSLVRNTPLSLGQADRGMK